MGGWKGGEGKGGEGVRGGVNIVFLYSLSMLRGEEGWMEGREEGRRKEREREIEKKG